MKAGTTSLHRYLDTHPQISMSTSKELNFFDARSQGWQRGASWYAAQFDSKAAVRGEASPRYTNYPVRRGVPKRMHDLIPEAKLIYVVRDPVERIVSHYVHRLCDRREQRTLSEALSELDDNPYLMFSRYALQLSRFLEYFPLSRILVLSSEELQNDARKAMRSVFRFLEVEEGFWSERFRKRYHASRQKRLPSRWGLALQHAVDRDGLRRLSPDLAWHAGRLLSLPFSVRIERPVLESGLRGRLVDALRPDVERLERLVGRRFDGWKL